MTWNPTATVKAIQSTLASSGYFRGGVVIGEPFSPPPDLTAALYFMEFAPARATLASTIDVWELTARLYAKAGMDPETAESVELQLALGISQLESVLAGGFTLGGSIRAIDWVGEEAGAKVRGKWGHVVISGTIFRCVDLSLPLIVDDSASFAA